MDWSGARGEHLPGIALAECEAGEGAPRLVRPAAGWSRSAICDWLIAQSDRQADLVVGIDFSAALPFADAGAYFPGWEGTPSDAPELWALVDRICAQEPHLGASGFALHAEAGAHFRRMEGRQPVAGTAFPAGLGRLRVTEAQCRVAHAPAISSFNLIGAAQVGKASLAGMRLIHALRGIVPIWPFDPVPATGPLLVEIYTSIAAAAAGRPRQRAKMRDMPALNAALAALGSKPAAGSGAIDDHSADAIAAAAWLRRASLEEALWSPPALTPRLAATEGWTFGVR